MRSPGDSETVLAKHKRIRSKKLYATGVAHPAVFSDSILPVLAASLDDRHIKVLDPFAGVGKVHLLPDLVSWRMETTGVELEPEWAGNHPGTVVGDALALPFGDESFDAIVTSPTYGNRMADSHNAKDGSVRRSYTHDLGRTLTPGNSGSMQWGDDYREFHAKAWQEAYRVLRPGGRLVLNMSDHVRSKRRQYVTSWHTSCLLRVGFELATAATVETLRHREGANASARVSGEFVLGFDRP